MHTSAITSHCDIAMAIAHESAINREDHHVVIHEIMMALGGAEIRTTSCQNTFRVSYAQKPV
eukprot:COSAG01_NODE_611_length_14848_cov_207.046308_6_plen_62_part_00